MDEFLRIGWRGLARHAGAEALERYVDPDSWLERAARFKGSWWPAWEQWLAARSGQRVAPPAFGAAGKGDAVSADAPGRYVLEG